MSGNPNYCLGFNNGPQARCAGCECLERCRELAQIRIQHEECLYEALERIKKRATDLDKSVILTLK